MPLSVYNRSVNMTKFYIVTPAYNALHWLQGCVRSVADQVCDGIEVHHHVQDGGSSDGTQAWLTAWQREQSETPHYRLTFESAPDGGLYDAINKAWQKLPADADVTAHINSDEQYLDGVFRSIAAALSKHREVDMFITSYIVLDNQFRYICHRRPSFPNRHVSKAFIQIITNTCFYKASTFRARDIWFDISYKALADVVFFRDILATRPCILRLPELFGSTFVVTGSNVSWLDIAESERLRIRHALPRFVRKITPYLCKGYALLGIVLELFLKKPVVYGVYKCDEDRRSNCVINYPTVRWSMRRTSVPEMGNE